MKHPGINKKNKKKQGSAAMHNALSSANEILESFIQQEIQKY